MRRKAAAVLWIALSSTVLVKTAQEVVAQTLVCFKKKCVIYPDGSAVCEYTPVDCNQIEIVD